MRGNERAVRLLLDTAAHLGCTPVAALFTAVNDSRRCAWQCLLTEEAGTREHPSPAMKLRQDVSEEVVLGMRNCGLERPAVFQNAEEAV